MLKPLPPREAAGIGFARFTALFALATLVLALIGRRLELIDTNTLLACLGAVLLLVCVSLAAVGAIMTEIWRKGVVGFGRTVTALVLLLVTLAPFAVGAVAALSHPPLAEVSTDLADPPEFLSRPPPARALFAARPPADDRAGLQTAAYPDLATRRLALSTVEAHAIVHLAARELGWTIRQEQEPASEAVGGHIEAEGRTRGLGLPMDLSVRVVPNGDGSAIDLRSALRYPMHDLGENALAIRRLFARIDEVSSRAAR